MSDPLEVEGTLEAYFSPEVWERIRRRGRKEARLAKAIAELDATEEKLARVTRRWLKQRALVRRLERELDKVPAEDLPAMLRRQAT